MKNSKKIITVILLGAVLAAALPFSFAWFFSNKDVDLTNKDNFEIEVGQSLKIATLLGYDEEEEEIWSDFSYSVTFANYDALMDVTSNGQTFYTPLQVTDKEGVTGTVYDVPLFPMVKVEADKKKGKYIEIPIKIQTNVGCGIYLADSSSITPSDKINMSDFVPYDPLDPAKPGLSKNYIAGCARVAVIEDIVDSKGKKTGENLKQVWIPNEKYELKVDEDNRYVSFSTNGEREDAYGYALNSTDPEHPEAGTIHYYDLMECSNRDIALGTNLANYSAGLVRSSKEIIHFTDIGELQEKRLTLRVWFEGTDRECHEILNGGLCNFKFSFCALSKDARSQEDDNKLNAVALNPLNRKLYVDDTYEEEIPDTNNGYIWSANGIDWVDYSGVIPSSFGGKIIYEFALKNKETRMQEHALARKLSFIEEGE